MLRRTLAGLVALALLAGCSTSGANPSTTLSAWSKLYRSGAVRLLEDQSGYEAAVEILLEHHAEHRVLSFDSAKTDCAKWMHDARTAEKYPAPPPLVVSWSPFGSMKLTTAWRTWVSTAYRVARTCESAANAGELGKLESVLASVGGDIEGPENIMAKALKFME